MVPATAAITDRDRNAGLTRHRACAATLGRLGWAKLPPRGWHVLRHAFGTHAARLGVNPWTLMMWMGHKRIDETMLYVNLAHTDLPAHLPVSIPDGIIDMPRLSVIPTIGFASKANLPEKIFSRLSLV